MKQSKRRIVFVVIVAVLLVMAAAGSSIIGASPADCSTSTDITGSLNQVGNTVTGEVSNCTSEASNAGMVVIAAILNPDGTVTNEEIDHQTGSVGAGEKITFVSTIPECTVKVQLYKGNNPQDPANILVQRVYNSSKFCSNEPTPTPIPPTETPVPPTATPVPPTATPEPPSGQGCTPGYWRQEHHFDSWVNYSPSDNFETVFGVDASFSPHTLLDAVRLGGGGERAMARHAVAALLNAANPSVAYLYAEADVIAMVQNAYATGSFESTKNLFEAQNELGCPLD